MVEITPELAEICGIHAGDGYMRNDGKRKELDISGNVEEKDYYLSHVSPLFEKVFGLHITPKIFPSRNTFGFVLRDKNIIEDLHSLGFPYGNKTKIVKAPDFILNSQDLSLFSSFLRGVFDTDGCVSFRKFYGNYSSFKKNRHHYPSIQFRIVSEYLAQDIIFMIKKLGFIYNLHIQHPKSPRFSRVFHITINNASQVRKWMKEIGSKNCIKLSRYLIWDKLGFCPPNTSYEQREGILNGKIDSLLLAP